MDEKRELEKKSIQTRLRRIEGQVKGIDRMLEKDTCCKDVLIQVAAVRAAINKVGTIVFENYAKNCLTSDNLDKNESEIIKELVLTLNMFIK